MTARGVEFNLARVEEAWQEWSTARVLPRRWACGVDVALTCTIIPNGMPMSTTGPTHHAVKTNQTEKQVNYVLQCTASNLRTQTPLHPAPRTRQVLDSDVYPTRSMHSTASTDSLGI